MALHVHYKTLYISQLLFPKQEREIVTFCVFKAQFKRRTFLCAESNANELEQKMLLICITFGT